MEIRPNAIDARVRASGADDMRAMSKPSAVPPAAEVAEAKKSEREPSREEMAAALTSINSMLQIRAPGLEFSVDRDSDRAVVRVIDKDTKEVIRQMPSEEAIEIAKALDKLQSLLVKQSA